MVDASLEFAVVGQPIMLLDDAEKSFDVNEGRLLVPWNDSDSLLIDRYDCRAHLTDLNELSSVSPLAYEDYLSDDEIAVEKLCEFERYLELQVDIDEMTVQQEEDKKRKSERSRSQYGAVDFSYDRSDLAEVSGGTTIEENPNVNGVDEKASTPPEDPYDCPLVLQSFTGNSVPSTDKQGHIIEKTAVFVARQGNQMEIVLKTKQKDNPLFGFLNYDHELNDFYKEMVKLIRQGRFIPKARPVAQMTLETTKPWENKTIHEDEYELKLPKVDISNTAYASLISKFKRVNELAMKAASNKSPASEGSAADTTSTTEELKDQPDESVLKSNESESIQLHSDIATKSPESAPESVVSAKIDLPSTTSITQSTSNGSVDTKPTFVSNEEYEQYYQEYYKHYYAHYYTQFNDQLVKSTTSPLLDEQRSAIVQQAAKAAAIAASAAVSAMFQAKQAQKHENSLTSSEASMTPAIRGIIDKMAEYVTRNGPEFEELVVNQKGNDPRFGFLKSDHPLHSYYLTRRKQLNANGSAPVQGPTPSPADEGSAISTSTIKLSPKRSTNSPSVENLSNSASEDVKNQTLEDRHSSSISFRFNRPSSSHKLRFGAAAETDTTSDMKLELTTASSCPLLKVDDVHTTPSPSHGDVNDSSVSPIRFSLPGIPCVDSSDSSSGNSSPLSVTNSPQHSRAGTPPPSPSLVLVAKNHSPSPDAIMDKPQSPVINVASKSSPPVKVRPQRRRAKNYEVDQDTSALDSTEPKNAIESLLDTGDDEMQLTKFKEQLRLERRKRAAQLVAQLKLTASLTSQLESDVSSHVQSKAKVSTPDSIPFDINPPPAPDSVPAAVAHAVVASLKRRHDEASRLTLSMDAQTRKRMRSPPAAYAIPKESSHKPIRHSLKESKYTHSSFDSDEEHFSDRSQKKHKKHYRKY